MTRTEYLDLLKKVQEAQCSDKLADDFCVDVMAYRERFSADLYSSTRLIVSVCIYEERELEEESERVTAFVEAAKNLSVLL